MPKMYIIIILVVVVAIAGTWIALTHNKGAEKKVGDAGLVANTTGSDAVTSSQTPTTQGQGAGANATATQAVTSATIHTNKGDVTLEFFGTDAPNTVANFLKLAKDGFYDGTKFHRVIKGFMLQGGDPLTKDDSKMAMWGTGGPGYSFKDEIRANNKNDVGTISMANSGPNTNGSQFFINVAPNNFLDDKHTVFGRVTAGMDVVKAIESTPTNSGDRPLDPIIIKSVTLN
ncbi:MAG: Peptidylprolyl isomerase [Parcubacteria group bacterium Greene0714_7]|nr:MAG: Peptidylprolyl isomerase [Parcubacteria group bacterium Greene0714_7]